MSASQTGHVKVVEALLKAGAKRDHQDIVRIFNLVHVCVISAYVHPIQVHTPMKHNGKSVLNMDVVEDIT